MCRVCFPRLQFGFQYHTAHSTTFNIVQLGGPRVVSPMASGLFLWSVAIQFGWQEIIENYSQRYRSTSRCRSFTVFILCPLGWTSGTLTSSYFQICWQPCSLWSLFSRWWSNETSEWANSNCCLVCWTWITSHQKQCMECLFTFSRQAPSHVNPQLSLDSSILSSVTKVCYLGVTPSNSLTWSAHIDQLFLKSVRPSDFIKRLRSFFFPQYGIERFVDGCVMPILLYCSHVIFTGLQQKDFGNLHRALRLLSGASGLRMEWVHSRIVERHFKACDSFVKRILGQENHPLHPAILEAKSLQP